MNATGEGEPMTIDISDNNPRAIYTVAQGVTQTSFAVPFEFFADSDLNVYVDSVLKTITTHYTVSGGDGSTGTVTMSVTGAAGGSTVAITRDVTIERVTDFTPGVEINRAALNTQLDTLTAIAADIKDQALRAIRVQDFDPSTTGFEIPLAADRANKVFAFNSSGGVTITNEIGTYKGNWAASTAFAERDIIKDTSNSNIYLCLVAHTSSGSQPISTNADVAKWALLVDAATAATASASAASSASAAASSASAASSSASAAASSASAAASDASAAASSASSAAASYDSFDDRYLGAKSSDPSVDNDGDPLIDGALYFDTANNVMKVYDLGTTTWLRTTPTSGEQANIDTVADDLTAGSFVAGSEYDFGSITDPTSGTSGSPDGFIVTVFNNLGDITAVANIDSDVTAVAGITANVTSVAGIAADVSIVATNVADVTNFADVYYGPSATAPTLRQDGSALQAGDLYFNTVSDLINVWDGAQWQAAVASLSGALVAANNLSDLTNAATARTNLGLGSAATSATSDFAAASHTHTLSDVTDAGTMASQDANNVNITGGVIDGGSIA